MNDKVEKQKLIDIAFQLAAVSADHWHGKSREEHMAWVADQLRACGFDTVPMGASWGVLKESR